MITLDRLKLVASIDSISILDTSAFETNIKDGQLCSLNFYQQTPFLLRIKIDYVERELVVEFTGKVLLGDYPKLISEETIEQCFLNINALGFCKFDIDKMMESDVVSCDVTKDIECDDVPQLCTYIVLAGKNRANFNLIFINRLNGAFCPSRRGLPLRSFS